MAGCIQYSRGDRPRLLLGGRRHLRRHGRPGPRGRAATPCARSSPGSSTRAGTTASRSTRRAENARAIHVYEKLGLPARRRAAAVRARRGRRLARRAAHGAAGGGARADERHAVPQDRAARAPRGDHPARAPAGAGAAQPRQAPGAVGRRAWSASAASAASTSSSLVWIKTTGVLCHGRGLPPDRRRLRRRAGGAGVLVRRAAVLAVRADAARGRRGRRSSTATATGPRRRASVYGVELRFTPDITRNFPPEIGEHLARVGGALPRPGRGRHQPRREREPVPAGAVRARLRDRPRGRAEGGAARRRDGRPGVRPLRPGRPARRPPAARRARRGGRRAPGGAGRARRRLRRHAHEQPAHGRGALARRAPAAGDARRRRASAPSGATTRCSCRRRSPRTPPSPSASGTRRGRCTSTPWRARSATSRRAPASGGRRGLRLGCGGRVGRRLAGGGDAATRLRRPQRSRPRLAADREDKGHDDLVAPADEGGPSELRTRESRGRRRGLAVRRRRTAPARVLRRGPRRASRRGGRVSRRAARRAADGALGDPGDHRLLLRAPRRAAGPLRGERRRLRVGRHRPGLGGRARRHAAAAAAGHHRRAAGHPAPALGQPEALSPPLRGEQRRRLPARPGRARRAVGLRSRQQRGLQAVRVHPRRAAETDAARRRRARRPRGSSGACMERLLHEDSIVYESARKTRDGQAGARGDQLQHDRRRRRSHGPVDLARHRRSQEEGAPPGAALAPRRAHRPEQPARLLRAAARTGQAREALRRARRGAVRGHRRASRPSTTGWGTDAGTRCCRRSPTRCVSPSARRT